MPDGLTERDLEDILDRRERRREQEKDREQREVDRDARFAKLEADHAATKAELEKLKKPAGKGDDHEPRTK